MAARIIVARLRGSIASICQVSSPSKLRRSVAFGGADGGRYWFAWLGVTARRIEFDAAAGVLGERRYIFVERTEAVHAAGVMITEVEHRDRFRPLRADPALISQGVEAATRIDADAEGISLPLELRHHA